MERHYSFFLLFLFGLATAITAKSVTYPGIGTFDSHDFFHPIYRPAADLFLPQSPESLSPNFTLYTRTTQKDGEPIVWNDTASASASHFDGTKPSKVVVHGFIDNQLFAEWMIKLKDRLLEQQDVNVLLVYWPKGNCFPYGQATANTRVVGPMVAIQIQTFCTAKNTSPASFHIIGHSLGSHIAGYAGKFLGAGKLGRITGLDPAGPFFEGLQPEARLWHTDAQYVDSIHTDARPMLEVGFGMNETCSHVDIFPNGGKVQPGCTQERLTAALFHGPFEGSRRLVACNHQRAVDFYTEALGLTNPMPKAYQCESYDEFKAGKCADCGENGERCVVLGEEPDRNLARSFNEARRFYLFTGKDAPLLEKYPYLIRVHVPASTTFSINKAFDKTASLTIKFLATNGTEEEYTFNDNSKLETLFQFGSTYTYPGVMSMPLQSVQRIDFTWNRKGIFGTVTDMFGLGSGSRLFVEQIEVIALSDDTKRRLRPMVQKFCNAAVQENGIQSKTHVVFEQC